MKNTISLSFKILALLIFLTACSSNNMYRDNYVSCEFTASEKCDRSALQVQSPGKDKEYYLSFVEYDDQGQLRDRNQMQAVLDQYYQIAARHDVMLITFIHGWHHNASPDDDNILQFRGLLEEVSRYEGRAANQQKRSKRKILGLYVGWRGESIEIPYLKGVTFWDRKNTAHDVGQQGVTELLLKLEEIVNVKIGIGQESPPPQNSRLVVIGHSFGGAVLYTSLQKVLAERFINSQRGKTQSDSTLR